MVIRDVVIRHRDTYVRRLRVALPFLWSAFFCFDQSLIHLYEEISWKCTGMPSGYRTRVLGGMSKALKISMRRRAEMNTLSHRSTEASGTCTYFLLAGRKEL